MGWTMMADQRLLAPGFLPSARKTCSLSVYHTWLKPFNPTTEHFQREISVRYSVIAARDVRMCSRCRGQFSQAIADVKQGSEGIQARATPAANLEYLLNSVLDGDAELQAKFGAAPVIIAVGLGKLHGGCWYGGFLLRLFPLIASNDSPAPSFFSGTDRVTVILPIHVVLLWCQRFRLRQCAVPAPMANSGDTFCGPTVLSFIADQPLL
jgi:hypothetical protein